MRRDDGNCGGDGDNVVVEIDPKEIQMINFYHAQK